MEKALLYLKTPSNSVIDPPIENTKDELPIELLNWEDFEKLCLRLAELKHSIDNCEIYGIKGQKQDGIDIFGKKDNGKYSSYQCKRYKKVTVKVLEKAINLFKNEKYYTISDEFIFCTTDSLNTTQLQDKFNSLKDELKKNGITLNKWDKIQINRNLKTHPQIVYDFFGIEWVKLFNGSEQFKTLIKNRKLDANSVAKYRKELYKFYSAVFNNHDSSINNQEFRDQSLRLQDRFIMPDGMQINTDIDFKKQTHKEFEEQKDGYAKLLKEGLPNDFIKEKLDLIISNRNEQVENQVYIRSSIDSILVYNKKTIILGDAGIGKSTLLRNIVLDILSENPQYTNIIQNWGNLLPIWIPFAFITKNLTIDNNLNLNQLLKIWLNNQDKQELFELIEKALDDERLLLVIDGIDEYIEKSSAKMAISKIEIQSSVNNTRIIYSSRPYGYKILKDDFRDVKEISLLPFTESQQKEFIYYWYNKKLGDVQYAKNETNSFINELNKSNELKILAENPLLLGILVSLRIRNSVLPRDKSKALESITDNLINIHPQRRKTSAFILETEKFDFDLVEIFKELAFNIQTNFNDGVIEKDEAKKIIKNYLIKSMGFNVPKANKYSEEIFDIGANDFGIIVEKSSNEISFSHRLFQEYLVAKYIFQSDDEYRTILSDFGGNVFWHQVFRLYFGLIPSGKIKLFKESIDLIGVNNTNNEYQKQINFLKYDVVLTLSNSPIDLAKVYFEQIKQVFEYETNKSLKKIYWNLIINSLHNSKIKEEVEDYLFSYFPNYYKYKDYRIGALLNIEHEKLSQFQNDFLIKVLVNGGSKQKLEASITIRKFVKDRWLLLKINELLEVSSNPEIIAFSVNCIISDDVEYFIKKEVYEKFKNTEHPDISIFIIKLKIHLKIHTKEDLEVFLKIQKDSSFKYEDEILNIFISGWGEDENLLNVCLKSIENQRFPVTYIDQGIAWKILFHCFNKKEIVVDKLIAELQKEKFSINILSFNHGGWPYISRYFKDNIKLIPIVEQWIKEAKNFNEPEIAYASMIGRTAQTKEYIISLLPKSFFSHWFTMALLENWGNDRDVIDALKNFFESDIKNKEYSAHYFDKVFRDDKQKGIEILEKLIFNKGTYFRDRAIIGLINLDKEYFKHKILNKFVKEELPQIPKHDEWNSYYNIISTILNNFIDDEIVRKFVLSNVVFEQDNNFLMINYYPEDSKIVDNCLKLSLPLELDYRMQLIEKLGEKGIIDSKIISQIALFENETEDNIKITSALKYFNQLNRINPEKIIELCKSKVFYKGIDYYVQRQLAFCGYLITRRISEYLLLKDEVTGEQANPKILFEQSYQKNCNSVINLLNENFEYLFSEFNEVFFKKYNSKKSEPYEYWSFWAEYSNKSISNYPYILDFIRENEEKITDRNFIELLNKTSPKSITLKNILLRLIKSTNKFESIYAARILGKNFNDDEKVFLELSNIKNYFQDEPKILALCIGWPHTPIVKKFYIDMMDSTYHFSENIAYQLNFIFSDTARILKFFEQVFENYPVFKYEYSYFINPMIRRLSKDESLIEEIRCSLLTTNSISAKVSYYAILKSFNKQNKEIFSWKSAQNKLINNNFFGYNILLNEFMPLSEVINEEIY